MIDQEIAMLYSLLYVYLQLMQATIDWDHITFLYIVPTH